MYNKLKKNGIYKKQNKIKSYHIKININQFKNQFYEKRQKNDRFKLIKYQWLKKNKTFNKE